MAAFTYVPELPTSEVLGATIGKSIGAQMSGVNGTLDKIEQQIQTAINKSLEGDTKAYDSLKSIEKELKGIETTIKTLQKNLDVVRKEVSVTEKAIKVAELAVKLAMIAALLPVPPAAVFAIQLLNEAVVQLKQILTAIKNIIKTIEDFLQSILDRLEALWNKLNALLLSQATLSALGTLEGIRNYCSGKAAGEQKYFDEYYGINEDITEKDFEDLQRSNILDRDGVDIFVKVADTFGKNLRVEVPLGDSGVDFKSTFVQNKLKSTDPGKKIRIPVSSSGDYIQHLYIQSDVQPSSPSDRDPHGWSTRRGEGDNWWQIQTIVDGVTGLGGAWSEVQEADQQSDEENYGDLVADITAVDLSLISTGDLLNSSESLDTDTVLTVLDNDDASSLMNGLISKLDTLPIGSKIKHNIEFTIKGKNTGVNISGSDYYYTSSLGDVYRLELVVDPKTPKIANRRYVNVYNEDNIVVYTGTKSFALDDEVLLEETKVRLRQLLG